MGLQKRQPKPTIKHPNEPKNTPKGHYNRPIATPNETKKGQKCTPKRLIVRMLSIITRRRTALGTIVPTKRDCRMALFILARMLQTVLQDGVLTLQLRDPCSQIVILRPQIVRQTIVRRLSDCFLAR